MAQNWRKLKKTVKDGIKVSGGAQAKMAKR
jgi:hypothetical protein